jgi:hypothetical protein
MSLPVSFTASIRIWCSNFTASNAGVSLQMLVIGVLRLEIKLENWLLTERRKELGGNPEEESSEEG